MTVYTAQKRPDLSGARTFTWVTPAGKRPTEYEDYSVGQQSTPAQYAVQGRPADIGGYYMSSPSKAGAVMRPSATFNAAIDSLLQ